MMHNIFTPLSGALAQERVLEIVANNLANVSTTGFKEEKVSFKLIEAEPNDKYKEPLPPANFTTNLEDLYPLHGNDIAYVGISDVTKDFTQGPVVQTHNPLDLMIEGDGFLSAQTPEGVRYTRSGALTLDGKGTLVDEFGAAILGKKGPIILDSSELEINRLGEVYQDGEFVDRLQVTQAKDNQQMERIGFNRYEYKGPPADLTEVKNPAIQQGFLEGSNVNAIKNLTNMIVAHRSYEAYQKAIQNYDKMMEKSSNTLGEVRG